MYRDFLCCYYTVIPTLHQNLKEWKQLSFLLLTRLIQPRIGVVDFIFEIFYKLYQQNITNNEIIAWISFVIYVFNYDDVKLGKL